MKLVERRLRKLELGRQEEKSFRLPPGEAGRLLEAQIDSVRLRLKLDSEEDAAPDVPVELVEALIHAHLEENRLRREESEKRTAAPRWGRTFPTRRFST
jgi:hypothetical protein